MTRELLAQALVVLQPLLLALLTALVAWAVPALRRVVRNKLAADALAALVSVVAVGVAHAQKTVVEDLKDPARPGKWDATTAAAVKARVMRDAKALASGALADLSRLHGLDSEGLDKLLEHVVEAQVLELRQSAPVILEAADPPALTAPGGAS